MRAELRDPVRRDPQPLAGAASGVHLNVLREGFQRGAGVPQRGQLIHDAAVQHILIAVPCGFEDGGRLRRFLAAGGQLIQSFRQRFGPGAAGVKADIPLGRAETLEAEGVVAQQVAGSAVGIVFQCVGGVTADDAPQDGVGILCGQRVLAGDLGGKAVGGPFSRNDSTLRRFCR